MAGGAWRASDEERADVVALLVRHAGDGRLSFGELEGRVDEAQSARTLDQLSLVLRELPPLPPERPPLRPKPTTWLTRAVPAWVVALGMGAAWLAGQTGAEPRVRFVDGGPEPVVAAPVVQLPPAGPPPAEGTEAAGASVRAAYDAVFDGDRPEEAKAPLIVGPDEGLAAATDQVRATYPVAVATSRATVHEVVFTSPTHAAVRFEVTHSMGSTGQLVGGATYEAGAWKVDRGSICEVLALGQGRC